MDYYVFKMDIMRYGLRMKAQLLSGSALLVFMATMHMAYADNRSFDYLANLSLEDLSRIHVTSVSKLEESLSDAPASIYVITHNDIRRSGATSLPEILRLAPNLQVARTNTSSQYAISARGFNNSIGNKLLVLIDGRTIYTPLYSGVFWEQQDTLLEDIDRIEVISGPGAALWGANAVNGVINIITRPAANTQGALVSASVNTEGHNLSTRYGATADTGTHFRVYAKETELNSTTNAHDNADALARKQAGFRSDWQQSDDKFTVQGDIYSGKIGEMDPVTVDISGFNLLGRWSHRLDNGSELKLQSYYDLTERDAPRIYTDKMQIADIELQHTLTPLRNHQLLWGGGYRMARDESINSTMLAFLPAEKDLYWATVFVQDEVSLPARIKLTLGGKLESNSYTGTELLPSVRFAWKPRNNRLLWGEISRAVRAPARLDRDLYIFSTGGNLNGGPDFQSEVAKIAELGYRVQYSNSLYYSITAFYHRHDELRSIQMVAPGNFILNNQI